MMDTRDRLEQVGKQLNQGLAIDDKTLLDHHISREELWAVQPVMLMLRLVPSSIDPLSIIMDMRQYLVMEQFHGSF